MSRSLFARLARRYGPKVDVESRREFLRLTALAGAGLLLSGPEMRALAGLSSGGGKRVVVVGAGFAGLACAHELRSVGYDVSVVEARDRLGGRVLSFKDFVPDRNVEGGGELVGTAHPTWMAYGEKFKLEFLDVGEDDELNFPVMLNGRKLPDEAGSKLYDDMKSTHQKMIEDARAVNVDEPWKTPKAAEWDKRSTADWLKECNAEEIVKAAIAAEFTANNGAPLDRQSYLGNLAQIAGGQFEKYWTNTEDKRCKGGNQQLAEKLADAFGRDRITLKLPVTEIRRKGDGLVVTCADRRTLECDDVVLAVPPSVWSRIKIDPELPRELKVSMGSNVKYMSHVKKRFWLESKTSQYILSDGPVQMTWDQTDGQPDGEASLNSFSGGPAAETCRSWPKEKRDSMYRAELEKFYPAFGENFVKSRFMDWPGDEWTKASYSFPAPGEVTKVGPLLARGHGNLHFAGEHCCYKFVGYMEGGLNSGVTIARRLAKRDGVAKE